MEYYSSKLGDRSSAFKSAPSLRQERVLQTQVYDHEQIQLVFERDIQPLFEERKQFLQESIIDLATVGGFSTIDKTRRIF